MNVPNRYREQPPRTGWYALAAFFALVALGLGGFLLFTTLAGEDDPSDRTLPNYVGRPLAEVTADLLERDIQFQSTVRENPNFEAGEVNETDPGAGIVIPEGGTVTLYYNEDTSDATIPPLEGLTEAAARDTLTALGFATIEVRSEESDSFARGLVIRTDPAEGETVPVQDTVTLIVSSGAAGATNTSAPESTEGALDVPYVIGSSEAAARDKLADFDVTVTYSPVGIGNSNDGLVMDQDPHVGETINEGDPVTIIVGQAPDPPDPTNPQPTNPQPTNPQPTQPTQPTTPPTQATTPPTDPTTTTTIAATTTT